MSTQTLQPLIWLARSSTRPSVRDGTPPFSADAFRACRACKASGTIIAMFFIRACIMTLPFSFHSTLTPSPLGAVKSRNYGLHIHDEWESRNRTWRMRSEMVADVENSAQHHLQNSDGSQGRSP